MWRLGWDEPPVLLSCARDAPPASVECEREVLAVATCLPDGRCVQGVQCAEIPRIQLPESGIQAMHWQLKDHECWQLMRRSCRINPRPTTSNHLRPPTHSYLEQAAKLVSTKCGVPSDLGPYPCVPHERAYPPETVESRDALPCMRLY